MSYTAIFDDKGKPTRLVGRIVDISKQKQELENLKIISQTDSLTQLYNKTSLRALVEDFLANSPKDKIHSLFVIDIDKFKDVNDSFGHLMGDDILVRVSNDIKSVFRESDILSRFGGDEFVVFMKNISGSEFAINKANELLNKFRYTIGKDDVVLKVTGSIGISIYNEHGSTFDELFSKADTALYRAKENGRDRSVMFK